MSKKTTLTIVFVILINMLLMGGIYFNSSFTINSFFEGLLIETLGWVFAVTIFQSYYDEKIKARENSDKPRKSFFENGLLTEAEFALAKAKLLDENEMDAKQ